MTVPNDGAGNGKPEERALSPRDQARAERLLDYLRDRCRGENNARTVTTVATQLDCSTRKVRTLVTYLRQAGRPVCATPDSGYFWPASKAEARHTLAFLTSRIAATMSVRGGIERGLDHEFPDVPEGQLEIL